LGRECDAADLVGTGAGGVALERGMYAAMKCLCFCYLGLELALMRGPVALVGELGGGCTRHDSRGSAGVDVDDGSVLPAGVGCRCSWKGGSTLQEMWGQRAERRARP